MATTRIRDAATLAEGEKKVMQAGDTEVLLLRHEGQYLALEPKCPHAGAPLEQGAICNGRLVCPWHMGTFALPTGALLEPPPLRPLKSYAVQVDGNDLLVDSEPTALPSATESHATDDRTFVLIGAGAAACMAATTLRAEGYSGRLVAIDPVADEPIDRTQLSKLALAGKKPLDTLGIDALKLAGVERRVARVTKLDHGGKQVTLDDGSTLPYHAALLATGGKPRRLDVPGIEFAHTIRHSADVKRILEIAGEGKQAVVIGNSFIGLEAASALTQAGLQVTVLSDEPTLPFLEKFGPRVVAAVFALHEREGVTFKLATETTQIAANAVSARVNGADAQFVADLILLGVGVDPDLDFEHSLPAGDKGGVATDATLKVAEGLYVAGDIASVDGVRIEHWRLAEQHGKIAALGMLGQDARYEGVPFFWTFHFGKRFGYLGHAEDWDDIVYDGDVDGLEFLAFYVKDGVVAAVLSCGRDHETAALAEPMRQPQTVEQLRGWLNQNPDEPVLIFVQPSPRSL